MAESSDLQWLLTRNSSSKIVKRGGAGFLFSREDGNLKVSQRLNNVHSYKYSGLVNNKAIFITPTSSGVSIKTRKADADRHHVASAKGASKTLKSPAPRAAAGAAAKLARGYRDDLSRDASVRAARLASSQKNKN